MQSTLDAQAGKGAKSRNHRSMSSEGFDRMHAVAATAAYREAVRAAMGDLPTWLVPFSAVTIEDLERIATELNVGPKATFVDLACGAGGPALWMVERTGASVAGVDFSPRAIHAASELATKRGLASRSRFIVAEGTATGLPNAAFDGLMSVDALMFIDAPSAAREIARVLKPGAVAAIAAVESLVEPFMPTLVRDYRPVFERAGFEIVAWEHPFAPMERTLALHSALLQRADALRVQAGEAADGLIEEAREVVERSKPPYRVRPVFLVARRSANGGRDPQRNGE